MEENTIINEQFEAFNFRNKREVMEKLDKVAKKIVSRENRYIVNFLISLC